MWTTLGNFLITAFYALVLASVVYFVHKVAWLIRYRRLQQKMVARALEKLREEADTTVVRWSKGVAETWSEASASVTKTPTDYVRRVELELSHLERKLQTHPHPVQELLVSAVKDPHPEDRDKEVALLTIPRRRGEDIPVKLHLGFPGLPDVKAPDRDTLHLEVRSRYGFFRRSIAFFLGVADVVYSSQHVVRIQQDPKVPLGLIMRRMSLVLLILLALVVDIAFGLRKKLVTWVEAWLPSHFEIESELLRDVLPPAVGFAIWLACYGAIYVGLYVFLRRRSGRHLRELRNLEANVEERMDEIRNKHITALHEWTEEYARSLDDAAILTMNQARMLTERTVHRLRRRIASPMLLDLASEAAARFFERLPESAQHLQDYASTHKHSLRHAIWPNPKEMRYQTEISQLRHAWRDIEFTVNELRGQKPDPDLASQLWRSLVRYARMFPDVLPDTLFRRLQEAHDSATSNIVDETRLELVELDQRLAELATALQQTVEAATPLIESRIELTTRSMESEIAQFLTEALRVREQARLEAMAFEI